MSYAQIEAAVISANVNTGAEFRFRRGAVNVGGHQVNRLSVEYAGGNEYLDLGMLLDSLRQVGTVQIFEFRGRGRRGENPALIADIRTDTGIFQLAYSLPGND